jgi:hypothetical protein
MRWLLIAAALLFTGPASAGQVIELNRCDGGPVYEAGDRARAWKRNGDTVIIKHWQISSCALAVLEAKRIGVKVCYAKKGDPILWLHQTRYSHNGRWMYRDEAKIRFGISSPVNGYKKLHARQVGIPACSDKLVATRKVLPKAEVWYPRSKSYGKRSPWN